MFEQIFLLRNIHTKDQIMAKEMHDKLIEFAVSNELDQNEMTKTALDSNLGENIPTD
ncbi:22515_t:CDS:2, partial [Racocetra persica]